MFDNAYANLILDVDSYKASHFLQYPPGATHISSYVESRGGAYDGVLFFGLQAWLKDALTRPISTADIDEAEEILVAHGEPFNRAGWEAIVARHGGLLPLRIEALPEGMIVPTGTPLVQISNTDPDTPWLVSYVETALLRAVWYPTTVATRSKAIQWIIKTALDRTSDDPDGQLPFKLHDFGARGVSSLQSAGIGGLAHLVNFMGTDTVSALLAGRRYYNEPMAGFSIPAAEHSTITAWGRDREAGAYANMLTQFGGPGKIVAVVSDSYDLWNAVNEIWGDRLRDMVRTNGATLVVRPDSGDPLTVPVDTIDRLAARFGTRVNGKGYKVLPDYLRVIQGDGVNERSIRHILDRLERLGYAADNIAFGMGGQMLQQINRDTLRFAMKASAIRLDGRPWVAIAKAPKTDPSKASKAGRQAVIERDGGVAVLREEHLDGARNLLQPVYENGVCAPFVNFRTVRARASFGTIHAQ